MVERKRTKGQWSTKYYTEK